jgi:hypothetical protein
MIKNFSISDAVIFNFPDEIDLRGECELASVTCYVGEAFSVEMDWSILGSNQRVNITFQGVQDFEVRGRDLAYPLDSSIVLGISGFCSKEVSIPDGEFFIEPNNEMNYLAFVMNDGLAFLIKSTSAHMELR